MGKIKTIQPGSEKQFENGMDHVSNIIAQQMPQHTPAWEGIQKYHDHEREVRDLLWGLSSTTVLIQNGQWSVDLGGPKLG